MRKIARPLGHLVFIIAACSDDGVSQSGTTGDDSSGSDDTPPIVTTVAPTSTDPGSLDDTTVGEDTSTGDAPVTCGDGQVDPGEACDMDALAGETCEGLGFGPGTLACLPDCSDFDTSGCGAGPRCGDGQIDGDEDCDGADLGGTACTDLDFDAGDLACGPNCAFDTAGCISFACGDGTVQPPETCDGDPAVTCGELGFGAGEVACVGCQLDTSGCCGDMAIGGTEACDGPSLGGQTCAGLDFPGGTLACDAACVFDTSGCSVCNDGTIGPGEACDGAVLGGATCASIGMGFVGGTLGCNATTCQFDTSGCNLCGNGVVNAGEACDGTALGGATCTSIGMGFTGGTLACASECAYDTNGCTSFALPGAGQVVISEIMYDPALLTDMLGEWFELHNPSATETFELLGCTVESNNANETFTINASLSIAPGQSLVFARSNDANLGFAPNFVYPSTFTLGNTSDLVRLSCGGVMVDEVAYATSAPWPSGQAGRAINLDPLALDATANDDGANWCPAIFDYHMGERGTPGGTNTSCSAPSLTIGFCRLQFPLSIDAVAGSTVDVYGRVYVAGVTDQSPLNDPDPMLVGQLGYGPDGSDPASAAGWTWINAVPNPGWDGMVFGEPDNDEYQATLVVPAPPPTERDYAYRFSGDGGLSFTYCDSDPGGSSNGYDPANAGALTSSAAPLANLYFSEYVEGSGNNKAVEIHNASAFAAVLDGCFLRLYTNGAMAPSSSLALTGLLAAGDERVFCHGSSVQALLDVCDQTSGVINFNGDDAFALECGGALLDVIGQIGVDPGTAWAANGVSTLDQTLRRDCSVTTGDPDGSDPFDPSVQWNTFMIDSFGDLGQYVCP